MGTSMDRKIQIVKRSPYRQNVGDVSKNGMVNSQHAKEREEQCI